MNLYICVRARARSSVRACARVRAHTHTSLELSGEPGGFVYANGWIPPTASGGGGGGGFEGQLRNTLRAMESVRGCLRPDIPPPLSLPLPAFSLCSFPPRPSLPHFIPISLFLSFPSPSSRVSLPSPTPTL
jgi:hypothetical protein